MNAGSQRAATNCAKAEPPCTTLLLLVWPQVRLEGGCAHSSWEPGTGTESNFLSLPPSWFFPGQAQEQGFVLTQLLMPVASLSSAPAPWSEQGLLPDRLCTSKSPMASPDPGDVGLRVLILHRLPSYPWSWYITLF